MKLGSYYSIEDLKLANRRAGYYFFEASAMRFFNSRIMSSVFTGADGWYFVTSEQFDHNSPRLYTVRRMNPSGDVTTISDFQQYASRGGAVRAAERIAAASYV